MGARFGGDRSDASERVAEMSSAPSNVLWARVCRHFLGIDKLRHVSRLEM
jgi:hypothetical protein